MIDGTKKTHSTVAAVEWVEVGAETEQATTSTTNDTTPTPTGQAVKIADLLGHGQNAAVPLRHLKELAGLPGREVRRMIQSERLRGIPILPDSSVDPVAFVSFYESKGWMVGKNQMKNWRSAISSWERRDKSSQTDQPPAIPRMSYHTEIINGEEVDVADGP